MPHSWASAARRDAVFLARRDTLAHARLRQVATRLLLALTLVFAEGLIAVFEGGYNHAVKLLLFFGGTGPEPINRLFPPPTYGMPGDVFLEVPGVLRFSRRASPSASLALWRDRQESAPSPGRHFNASAHTPRCSSRARSPRARTPRNIADRLPPRSIESPMSVLWVIATMMRPCESAMARKSAWGLSVPRSRGSLPGPPHEKMLGTCLMSLMVNRACRIGLAGATSTIGNSGSTRAI